MTIDQFERIFLSAGRPIEHWEIIWPEPQVRARRYLRRGNFAARMPDEQWIA